MTDPKLKLSQEWFQKGNDDLESACILLKEAGPINTICFLSHQSSEKYLKGYLLYLNKPLRKTHDLIRLVKEISKSDEDFLELLDHCEFLNPYYIESRYPVHPIAIIPKSSAKKSIEAAKEIINLIQRKIF